MLDSLSPRRTEGHSHQKISDTHGRFTCTLDDGDHFVCSAALGDLYGDGLCDLAMGAQR